MKKYTFFISTVLVMTIMALQSPLFAAKHTVLTGNYYFNPASLNVAVGDTIRWQWVNGSHTTTSSSIPAGAATWDKLITSSNQVYEYQVTVAGTYNYVCTPHVGMGMIASFVATDPAMLTVLPPSQIVPKTAGQTTFSVTSNGNWTTSSDAIWCTATPSGSGNGTIVASFSANPDFSVRTATITVSLSGATPVNVQVIQDASTLGIPGNSGSTLLIYPNPAKDKLNIGLDKMTDNSLRIQLIDLTGKTVMDESLPNQEEVSLDVSDLPRGCYFVKVMLKDRNIVKRITLTE
jgi:plastocyanin